MTEILLDAEWIIQRILFLETIAGVPGMVAATIRHLRSLRLMRRDAGWIHTLLEVRLVRYSVYSLLISCLRKPRTNACI